MPYRTRLKAVRREYEVRVGRDVSWQEVANKCEISYSTIQRYIHEAVPRPDFVVIDRLAQFFDVGIRELVYSVDDDLLGNPTAATLQLPA